MMRFSYMLLIGFGLALLGCGAEPDASEDIGEDEDIGVQDDAVIAGCKLDPMEPFRSQYYPDRLVVGGTLSCDHPVAGYHLKVCLQQYGAAGWFDKVCDTKDQPFPPDAKSLGHAYYADGTHGQHKYRSRLRATNSAAVAYKHSDFVWLGF